MTLSDQLASAVQEWLASRGDPAKEAAVHALLASPDHKAESYLVRNRSFISSHKLLALEYDPYLCWLEFVAEEPKAVDDDSEALVVGQAVDDLVTLGQGAFEERYAAVARRDKKAEEATRKFKGKERAYLSRKIEQAVQHERGRIELKLTSKDAEQRSVREVQKMHEDEIDHMAEFELYRAFLRSLQNGFEHCRSIASFLKRQEENPSDQ